MSQVKFFTATKAQYTALLGKDPDALYFLTDTNELYKGSDAFSHPVQVVESFPITGQNGNIYVQSGTYVMKAYVDGVWTQLTPSMVTEIGANPTDSQLPTAQAVKEYVDGQIVNVNAGVSGAVANVSYANKSISVQKGTGDPVTTALQGLVDGASYDGATGVLTLTTNGGTPVTVNLPVENFLSAASFDATTNVLTLTLTGGETVTVNLADLVDTYTGANGATANVSIAANGAVSASVNVSAQSGNIIEAKNDGIFAAVEWQSLS